MAPSPRLEYTVPVFVVYVSGMERNESTAAVCVFINKVGHAEPHALVS